MMVTVYWVKANQQIVKLLFVKLEKELANICLDVVSYTKGLFRTAFRRLLNIIISNIVKYYNLNIVIDLLLLELMTKYLSRLEKLVWFVWFFSVNETQTVLVHIFYL